MMNWYTYYRNNTGPYFAPASDQCNGDAGGCSDDTRWLIWPDSSPLPVNRNNGALAVHLDQEFTIQYYRRHFGYTAESQIPIRQPANYETTQAQDALPSVTPVNEAFYPSGVPAYGDYGRVVSDDTAPDGVALARVVVSGIEDISEYSYYSPSTDSWSQTQPSILYHRCHSRGKQRWYGTARDILLFQLLLVVCMDRLNGSPSICGNSVFQISTAPSAEGPWTTPETFYTPAGSTFNVYSQQAASGFFFF